VVKAKSAKNYISQLINENGVSVFDPAALKELAPAYYQYLFNHKGYWNVFPKVVARKKLTTKAASWLEKPVTSSEIHKSLKDMHPEKAPGPNGFNVMFFRKMECGGQ